MKNLITGVVVLALVFMSSCNSAENKKAEIKKHALSARKADSLKDYQKSISELSKIIELDPENSWAYYLRGFTKMNHLKDPIGGNKDVRIAKRLGLDPKLEASYELYFCMKKHDWLNAAKYDEKLLNMEPTSELGIICKSYLYGELKQYAEGIAFDSLALQNNPLLAPVWNNMGYAKLELGQTMEAMHDIRKSIQIEASNPYAYRNLALCKIQLAEYDSANIYIKKGKDFQKAGGKYSNDDIKSSLDSLDNILRAKLK